MMGVNFKWFLFTVVLILAQNNLCAQKKGGDVEDDNCTAPSSKTMKLIHKAKSPETELLEKYKLFKKAIDSEDKKAAVYYEFAQFLMYKASQAQTPSEIESASESAYKNFKKASEICDDYHADMYYNMALYHYNKEERQEALVYFKKFLEFDHPSKAKYSAKHAQKVADVQEIMPEIEFFDQFYNNKVPFDPIKVDYVSTGNDEYLPMISPDNELIFYTRKLDRRLKGDIVGNIVEEFTLSRRPNVASDFDDGKPFQKPFNDPVYNNFGGISISVDNKEMIICACKYEMVFDQRYNNCDLYSTTYRYENGEYYWSELVNLGTNINTADGWEAQPSLSPDGKKLYFATNRKGSRGVDIYEAERNDEGEWQKAKPISGGINTDLDDKSPFLHQDSETLYFVSQCSIDRMGAGGFDIFYIQKDENGNWGEPKNIGYPINSAGDEVGLFVSTDGKTAYFASNRVQKSVSWDIYSFDLYEQARPKKVLLVKGELKDEEGKPVEDATIQLTYAKSEKTEEIKVNGNDGKYAVVIKAEEPEEVLLTVKKEGHAFDSRLIDTEEQLTSEVTYVEEKNLKVEKIKEGRPYTINDILFATAKWDLNDKSKFILKNFAQFLKENPTIKISINGHTDSDGIAENNLILSQNRAESVKDYLASLGIDKDRLEAKGFGQTQPRVPNTTPENKAQNRRTDFVILSK